MTKNAVLFSILFLSSISQALPQLKIFCNENTEGFQVNAMFDSNTPFFRSIIVTDPQRPIEEQYISSDKVCGLNINFAEKCKGIVKSFQGDAGYTFACNNGVEGSLSLNSDELLFSCSGPQVSENYENLLFSGCKFSN